MAVMTLAKSSMGVMVFGAIGIGCTNKLVHCSKRVNSAEIIPILMESAVPDAVNTGYECTCHFVQDGAPCHTAAQTMELLQQVTRALPILPPNSPDLNSIEDWQSFLDAFPFAEAIIDVDVADPGDIESEHRRLPEPDGERR